MICAPSVQGKSIAHAESFEHGVTRLALTLPRGAKGTLLTVKVTIKLVGTQVTRVAVFRVG